MIVVSVHIQLDASRERRSVQVRDFLSITTRVVLYLAIFTYADKRMDSLDHADGMLSLEQLPFSVLTMHSYAAEKHIEGRSEQRIRRSNVHGSLEREF